MKFEIEDGPMDFFTVIQAISDVASLLVFLWGLGSYLLPKVRKWRS